MRYADRLVHHDHILFADFETYFDTDYTLKKLNTSSYVRDSRFKAHMLGVQLDDGSPDVIEGKHIAKYLKKIKWNKTAVVFHNCAFDGLILQHHYGVLPAYYYDTLAMARVLHGADIRADLDTVARFYGVGNKLPDVLMRSKGVADLRSVPGLYDDMAVYCAVDTNVMHQVFWKMIAGSKETMLPGPFPIDELDLIHITTRMFCQPSLRMDKPLLRKLIVEETSRKEALFRRALPPELLASAKQEMLKDKDALKNGKSPDNLFDLAKWVLGKDRFLIPMMEALGLEPPMKWSEKQEKMIYATAKGDLTPIIEQLEDEAAQLLNDDENDSPRLGEIEDITTLLEAKLETSSNIATTRAQRFLDLVEGSNLAPVGYNYGAAHTFRWGGANKCNFQNMGRGSKLRDAIMAQPHCVLRVADSKQIEARVIAALAGAEWKLEAFRLFDAGKGPDQYRVAASNMYNKAPADVTGDERQMGKISELACGFGGASGAFGNMAKVYGVHLPDNEIAAIVRKWRAANPEIVQLWADLEGVLLDMFLKRKGEFGPLRYEGSRYGGKIIMPNGLCLKYPDLVGEIDERNYRLRNASFTYKGAEKKIYGGSCSENIVQCLARIIVGEQMLTIERNRDYQRMKARLVMMTHDETVSHHLRTHDKEIKEIIIDAFTTPPSWWPDLPVNCDTDAAVRYSK